MRTKWLVIVMIALWAWTVPIAQSMPIDADGPHGLSDNADFDDLIVSLTSPTLAVTPAPYVMVAVVFVPVAIVPLVAPCAFSQPDLRSVGSRAPPRS